MLQIYVLNNKVAIEQSVNFLGLINLEISQLRHMTFFKKYDYYLYKVYTSVRLGSVYFD